MRLFNILFIIVSSIFLGLAIAAPVDTETINKRQLGTVDYLAGTSGNPAVGAVGNLAPHGNVMAMFGKLLPVLNQFGNVGNGKASNGS